MSQKGVLLQRDLETTERRKHSSLRSDDEHEYFMRDSELKSARHQKPLWIDPPRFFQFMQLISCCTNKLIFDYEHEY